MLTLKLLFDQTEEFFKNVPSNAFMVECIMLHMLLRKC